MAVTITDRNQLASGDGLFMRVIARAVCSDQSTLLSLSNTELVDDLLLKFDVQPVNLSFLIGDDLYQ